MQIGDLVWVVGRPKDGWVKSLGIIVRTCDTNIFVSPMHAPSVIYKLMYGDVVPYEEK